MSSHRTLASLGIDPHAYVRLHGMPSFYNAHFDFYQASPFPADWRERGESPNTIRMVSGRRFQAGTGEAVPLFASVL